MQGLRSWLFRPTILELCRSPAAWSTQAREALDAWVREVVAWHFDPATGSPFWLDTRRSSAGIRGERVTRFDDLQQFGRFEDEWLRGGPVQRWVPEGLRRKAGLRVRDRWHDRCSEDAHQLRGLPDRLRDLQHDTARRAFSERRATG